MTTPAAPTGLADLINQFQVAVVNAQATADGGDTDQEIAAYQEAVDVAGLIIECITGTTNTATGSSSVQVRHVEAGSGPGDPGSHTRTCFEDMLVGAVELLHENPPPHLSPASGSTDYRQVVADLLANGDTECFCPPVEDRGTVRVWLDLEITGFHTAEFCAATPGLHTLADHVLPGAFHRAITEHLTGLIRAGLQHPNPTTSPMTTAVEGLLS